ncbi:MAG: hypothetical protein ACYDH5_08585 [Acidimicrobiales bacterium]
MGWPTVGQHGRGPRRRSLALRRGVMYGKRHLYDKRHWQARERVAALRRRYP